MGSELKRTITVPTLPAPSSKKLDLYTDKGGSNIVWGSRNQSHYVDVLSVGPIGGVVQTFFDDTDLESGEFPLSRTFNHDGSTQEKPWNGGGYPYVERTISVSKTAETADEDKFTKTEVTRQVTGKGVRGIKVNFNTSTFTQKDNKNRRKLAQAYFVVSILHPETGARVASTSTSSRKYYYAQNPTSVSVTVMAPNGYEGEIWEYEIEMFILGRNYGVPVAGTWNLSTITELFVDTQTYQDIAFTSGTVISTDVNGKIPKRTYVTDGYMVQVPRFENVAGKDVFTGFFDTQTSNSHAWNILAVLTDTKWGGALPLERINLLSFLEFEKYCAEDVNGQRRHSFSQYLKKPTNYFKVASQMAGSADGKLFEDTSGRIGILIDKEIDERRVVTSYDIVDERVKRTTVANSKRLNYITAEFDDESNNYEKQIIFTEDNAAITSNGLIKKDVKLDSCTNAVEADRIIRRMLATSQYISDTYTLTLGYAHEDVQIGEILEVYDRVHSKIDYCGKIAAGSTVTDIEIDRRTPIDLMPIAEGPMEIRIWTGSEVLTRIITRFTSNSLTVSPALPYPPEPFWSFGVRNTHSAGLKPTLMKVMGISDEGGRATIEAVAYNHSLFSYVDNGTGLELPNTGEIPDVSDFDIANLQVFKRDGKLVAEWDPKQDYTFAYLWRKFDEEGGGSQVLSQGTTTDNFHEISVELEPAKYAVTVYAIKEGVSGDAATAQINLSPSGEGTSTLETPTNLGLQNPEGGDPVILYTGRGFTVVWDYTDDPILNSFFMTLQQGEETFSLYIPPTARSFEVTDALLIEQFGSDYGRSFDIRLVAIDNDLLSSLGTQVTVNNPPPVAPQIQIEPDGDVIISTLLEAPLEPDVVGAFAFVWESDVPNAPIPNTAEFIQTEDPYLIVVPEGVIEHEDKTYNYVVGWLDTFGPDEANETRTSYTFGLDTQAPEALDLLEAVGLTTTSIRVNFQHSGEFLKKIKVQYKKITSETWIDYGTEYIVPEPPDVHPDVGFDGTSQTGFFNVNGLIANTEYHIRAIGANTYSPDSEVSNYVTGTPLLDVLGGDNAQTIIEDILGDLEEDGLNFDIRELFVEGVTDVFEDYDNTAEIYNETVVRETQYGKTVASLDQIRADFDDPTSGVYALIADLRTVTANEDEALAQRISLTEAAFGDGFSAVNTVEEAFANEAAARASQVSDINAKIGEGFSQSLTVRQAITDEESARATAVSNVNAKFGNSFSTVYTVEDAISDEQSARAQDISAIEAKLGDNFSNVNTVRAAITDAESARASLSTTLNTKIDEEVARVEASAKAAIGYCLVGGQPSGHGDKSSCEGVGGTWVQSGFASAVNNVQISGASGNLTIGDHYQAFTDLDGQLNGKAVMGVNVNGQFTGLEVLGGNSFSSLTFKAGGFNFVDSNDVTQLAYSSGNWVFSGNIEAADISGSTISGSTITGSKGIFDKGLYVDYNGGVLKLGIDSSGNNTADVLIGNSSNQVKLGAALEITGGGNGIVYTVTDPDEYHQFYGNVSFVNGLAGDINAGFCKTRWTVAERSTYSVLGDDVKAAVKNLHDRLVALGG